VSGGAIAWPRPLPSAPRSYHFPPFERRTLASGIQIVVAPVDKLPVVSVLCLVDAGAVCDPVGLEGLAQLTARALAEGTKRSVGDELAERFERLGSGLDTGADWDGAVVRLTVLTERLPEAMALLAEVLTSPSFPEREVERLKAERMSDLLQQQAEPRGLADDRFSEFIYAPSARYRTPDGGSESSVPRITRDAVEAFYRERYRAAGVTIVVAGAVRTDDVAQLVASVFDGWQGGAPPPAAATPDVPASAPRAVHVVAKSDAPQSELRIGHVGLPRSHPEYFPVVVMNAVLGGLFSSRINLNLREVHAYTYGAFSGFDWRRGAGPFIVSTAVKSDVTDAAAREVLVEIERMRSEPITESELSLATSYLVGVFPIRYETTAAISGALANMVLYGLPEDYFDRYRDQIASVTAEDVLRVARTHVRPDQLQVVVVGDPAVVEGPLRDLAIGPVTVHEARSAG
jgi:zinc protease